MVRTHLKGCPVGDRLQEKANEAIRLQRWRDDRPDKSNTWGPVTPCAQNVIVNEHGQPILMGETLRYAAFVNHVITSAGKKAFMASINMIHPEIRHVGNSSVKMTYEEAVADGIQYLTDYVTKQEAEFRQFCEEQGI